MARLLVAIVLVFAWIFIIEIGAKIFDVLRHTNPVLGMIAWTLSTFAIPILLVGLAVL